MDARPDKPTSIRLSPEDVDRIDAVRAAMAKASGLDSAGGVSRHVALLAAVRLGLEGLEARHLGKRPRKR